MCFPKTKSIHSCFRLINNEYVLDARHIHPPRYGREQNRQTDKTLISWRLHYFGVGEKDHNQTPSGILCTVIIGIKRNIVRRAAEGSQERVGVQCGVRGSGGSHLGESPENQRDEL